MGYLGPQKDLTSHVSSDIEPMDCDTRPYMVILSLNGDLKKIYFFVPVNKIQK